MNPLLCMNQLEIAEYVNQHVERNPVLKAGFWERSSWQNQIVKYGEAKYVAFRNFQRFTAYSGKSMQEFRQWSERQSSLKKHLRKQLNESGLLGGAYDVCNYLITKTDEKGYLTYKPAEASGVCQATPWDVELADEMIKSMDPVGVGMKDREACLQKQEEKWAPAEPKPGIRYEDKMMTSYIVPDLIVQRGENGLKLSINVTGCNYPELDNRYRSLIPDIAEDRGKMQRLASCYEYGEALIRSLNVRNTVLWVIGQTVLDANQEFFRGVASTLKDITIEQLSAETGITTENLQQVLPGKYIQCRGKVYSLKYFLA